MTEQEKIDQISKLIQETLTHHINDPLTELKYEQIKNTIRQDIINYLPIINYEVNIVKEKCTDNKMVFNIKSYQTSYLINFVLD